MNDKNVNSPRYIVIGHFNWKRFTQVCWKRLSILVNRQIRGKSTLEKTKSMTAAKMCRKLIKNDRIFCDFAPLSAQFGSRCFVSPSQSNANLVIGLRIRWHSMRAAAAQRCCHSIVQMHIPIYSHFAFSRCSLRNLFIKSRVASARAKRTI